MGASLAAHLQRDARVSSVLLLDKDPSRVREVSKTKVKVPIEAKRLDARHVVPLARAIRDSDVVVNTASPEHNLSIMRAALAAGAHYLDVAGTGPHRPGGPSGILEQLRLHDRFRDAGLTALVSMGLDPGMSNVMARDAADSLDSIDAIRIRSGGTLRFVGLRPAPRFVPLYSKGAFFSDVVLPPTVWSNGRLQARDVLSEEEDYSFPDPVGVQPTFLVSHEEVKTLPRYLGKPVRNVDFKYAIDPHLARALRSLGDLGLLDSARRIRVDRGRISFFDAFQAAFPDILDISSHVRGTKCVTVEIAGLRRGVREIRRSHILMPHAAAQRRGFTTAVYCLTGAAAAIGSVLLGEGAVPGPGVYPAEALDPRRVITEWVGRRLPICRHETLTPS